MRAFLPRVRPGPDQRTGYVDIEFEHGRRTEWLSGGREYATTSSADPFRFPRPIRSAALVRFGLDFDDGAAHARAALAVVVVHRKLGLAPDDANHEDETAPSEYAGAAPAHTLGAGATPAGPSALSEAAVPAEGEAEARPQPRKRHQKRLRRQSGNARKASKGPGRAATGEGGDSGTGVGRAHMRRVRVRTWSTV